MFVVKPFKHFSLAYFSIKKGKTYVLVKVKETSKSSHWRSCSKLRSTLGRGRCPLFWHLVKLIWDSRDGGLSSYMLYIHHTKFETRLFSTFFLTVCGNVPHKFAHAATFHKNSDSNKDEEWTSACAFWKFWHLNRDCLLLNKCSCLIPSTRQKWDRMTVFYVTKGAEDLAKCFDEWHGGIWLKNSGN